MLQCSNIRLSLGDRALLDDLSVIINPGDRIGLVGPNGAGKSTLLKVIMGLQEVDGGQVSLSKSESLGYLPQDGVDPDFNLTVVEEVETIFQEIFDLEREVQTLQHSLSELDPSDPSYAQKLEQLGILQNQLEQSGLYSLRSKVEKVLSGLGFSSKDFHRTTKEFSGGWLMRIALSNPPQFPVRTVGNRRAKTRSSSSRPMISPRADRTVESSASQNTLAKS